jgi:hypothetical protein
MLGAVIYGVRVTGNKVIEGRIKREERTRQSRVPESDRSDLAAENALARAVLLTASARCETEVSY